MSRPGMKFIDDLEVVACVDLVRRKDAIFTVDFKDGDGTIRSRESWKAWDCARERSCDI